MVRLRLHGKHKRLYAVPTGDIAVTSLSLLLIQHWWLRPQLQLLLCQVQLRLKLFDRLIGVKANSLFTFGQLCNPCFQCNIGELEL